MRGFLSCLSYSVLLVSLATGGYTMEEDMAIHPDGTPVYPEKMRESLRSGDVFPELWREDMQLRDLVDGDNLQEFADYMQQINYEKMFHPDGSARDIAEWRQSVRDDEWYANLLKEGHSDFYELIMDGADEEVQSALRAARAAQLRARDEL